jgi:hypothetical protein
MLPSFIVPRPQEILSWHALVQATLPLRAN